MQERRYGLNSDDVALGLTWFFIGMFKKVVPSPTSSPDKANNLFANPQSCPV